MAYTTINDGSAHFHTQLYTGNGASTHAITNDANSGDFKPDWLWIKQRSQGNRNHSLWDSSRGNSLRLISNTNGAEETQTGDQKTFDTDGFTLGGGSITNENSQTHVAWQWKANGGTTASNSNGSITSTVQANTAAGFSIITYTGNGSDGATIGHGLNATPQVFFPKCRSTTTNWEMYYFPTGGTKQYGYLNDTNAFATWSHTAPTSTTIGLSGSGDSNGNGRTMVGYAFHSVKGYSKIGTYVGNGQTSDNTFIYTGFRRAWVIVKCTTNVEPWFINDTKRSPGNPTLAALRPEANSAENTTVGYSLDFVSNGFKIRNNAGQLGGDGRTHFYMAFAENPFVSSAGVPVTAR